MGNMKNRKKKDEGRAVRFRMIKERGEDMSRSWSDIVWQGARRTAWSLKKNDNLIASDNWRDTGPGMSQKFGGILRT
jgi:hypothetical protein